MHGHSGDSTQGVPPLKAARRATEFDRVSANARFSLGTKSAFDDEARF
jgi:hypothetical protein